MSENTVEQPPLYVPIPSLDEDMRNELSSDNGGPLAQSMASPRTTRNSIIHINTVPPEVLMQIFQDLAFFIPFDFRNLHHPVAGRIRDLTSLVSVCRHWRQICLSFARLWCHIPAIPNTPDCAYSKLTTQYLRRARSVPLRMSVVLPEADSSSTTATSVLLRDHSRRIQELYLEHTGNPAGPLASELLDVISHPAPLLECLVVTMSNRTWFHPWPSLPVLFSGEMHNVRALALQTPRAFYPGNSLEKLVHVRLSFDGPRMLLQPLFQFLRSAPQLETLWIARCGIVRKSDELNLSPVRLCRLHTISLAADPYTAFTLLSFLDVPSCTTLHLPSLAFPFHSEVDFPVSFDQRLLDRLSSLISVFDVTSLDIMDFRRQTVLDETHPHRRGHYIIADGPHSGLWMLLDTFVAAQVTDTSLQALHQSLPLHHVATARLAFARSRTALLLPLVAALPSLTTLVLRCPGPTTDDQALAMLSTIAASLGGTGDVPCAAAPAPLLVSLAVEAAFAVPAGGLEPLVRMAAARARAGCALQELVLCAPELSEEDLRPFRAYVAAVRLEGTAGALWPLRVDDKWRIKNDYWTMYDEHNMFQRFPSHCD